MARDPEQTGAAAARVEAWLDQLDPAVLATPEADASDLRAISAAQDALHATISAALSKGRSWSPIAMALNTTRREAQAQYESLTPAALAAQRARVEEWSTAHRSTDPNADVDDAALDEALARMDANSADLYVHVGWTDPTIVRTDDLGRGVSIDYDEHGGVVGIEALDSTRLTIDGTTQRLTRTRTAKLTDDELENIDADEAFANADLASLDADAADLRAVTDRFDALAESVRQAAANGRAWSRIGGLMRMTGRAARVYFHPSDHA